MASQTVYILKQGEHVLANATWVDPNDPFAPNIQLEPL